MSDNPKQAVDHELLAESLSQLLQGQFVVGPQIMKIGGAIKREGKNHEWVGRGLARWLTESEDALPLLAGALTAHGAERLREYLQERFPEDSAKATEAEVQE